MVHYEQDDLDRAAAGREAQLATIRERFLVLLSELDAQPEFDHETRVGLYTALDTWSYNDETPAADRQFLASLWGLNQELIRAWIREEYAACRDKELNSNLTLDEILEFVDEYGEEDRGYFSTPVFELVDGLRTRIQDQLILLGALK